MLEREDRIHQLRERSFRRPGITLNADSGRHTSIANLVIGILHDIGAILEEHHFKMIVISWLLKVTAVVFERNRTIGRIALDFIRDSLGCIAIDIEIIPKRKERDARIGTRRKRSFRVGSSTIAKAQDLRDQRFIECCKDDDRSLTPLVVTLIAGLDVP